MSSHVVTIAEGMKEKKKINDKNWDGVCCKGKGWRDGGEHNGGNKQKYEERGDVMCPGCGWEEEILISIRMWTEERCGLLFPFVFMFGKRD